MSPFNNAMLNIKCFMTILVSKQTVYFLCAVNQMKCNDNSKT